MSRQAAVFPGHQAPGQGGSTEWVLELSRAIHDPRVVAERFGLDPDKIREVANRYPMRISLQTWNLIREVGDPIYRQWIPDPRELADTQGMPDPLEEERLSPVPGLTHRYPDRVLLLVSTVCAAYCRFCNRKRLVGREIGKDRAVEEAIGYIRRHTEVRDVLLSGGDPLLLPDDRLEAILRELRAIPHVEILRIGTRVPGTLPKRVTPGLARMLGRFQPLYVNIHFNHPREVTAESEAACSLLARAGVPLGSQTVLLKGVNDSPEVIRRLMRELVRIRVRPYYLFQADLVRGTSHFWTPLRKGLEIMGSLQGHTSGLCVPHFAVDLPGGGGKVPLLPPYVVREEQGGLVLRNYLGKEHRFPLFNEQ